MRRRDDRLLFVLTLHPSWPEAEKQQHVVSVYFLFQSFVWKENTILIKIESHAHIITPSGRVHSKNKIPFNISSNSSLPLMNEVHKIWLTDCVQEQLEVNYVTRLWSLLQISTGLNYIFKKWGRG